MVNGACFHTRRLDFEWATRSLATFVRSTAHSVHSLSSTLPHYTRSIHGLALSLCSLSRGTIESNEYVFPLFTRSTEGIAIVVVTRNTSKVTCAQRRVKNDVISCVDVTLSTFSSFIFGIYLF